VVVAAVESFLATTVLSFVFNESVNAVPLINEAIFLFASSSAG